MWEKPPCLLVLGWIVLVVGLSISEEKGGGNLPGGMSSI
jgi:hypothetical protein